MGRQKQIEEDLLGQVEIAGLSPIFHVLRVLCFACHRPLPEWRRSRIRGLYWPRSDHEIIRGVLCAIVCFLTRPDSALPARLPRGVDKRSKNGFLFHLNGIQKAALSNGLQASLAVSRSAGFVLCCLRELWFVYC